MSRSLIKIVDISLFPAALLIIGKILGIFLSISVFKINTGNTSGFSLLSLGPTVSAKDLQVVTTYSDLVMYGLIATYFTIILVKAVFLHDSHIKPTLVTKLAEKNLLKLIQTSYEIYHYATVALIFLWIATFLILANTLMGNSFLWLGVLGFVVTVMFTTLLIQDVYREIENIKHHPGKYNWN